MTWMTPFDCMTFVIETFATPPLASSTTMNAAAPRPRLPRALLPPRARQHNRAPE